ncbi:vWA domain-containing protein [Anaerosolibacter sp.]|uniref:vWA domain-containing protein n=1 Tax=Anaerosolibacter sp. TaxID=1872527 RepID=UPI0039F12CE8
MNRRRVNRITMVFLICMLIFSSIGSVIASGINSNTKAPISLVKTVEKNQLLKDEIFTINYLIQPDPIPMDQIIPESYIKDKEIVLVMDTSGSMDEKLNGHDKKSRIKIAKEAADLFVTKFKNDSRVRVGLVSYNSVANAISLDNHSETKYFVYPSIQQQYNRINNEINKLHPEGGTNIGDGLRNAYYLFKNYGNPNARKFIVLMTDGEPTGFSYTTLNTGFALNYSIGEKHENGRKEVLNWRQINGTTYKLDDGVANKYFVNYGTNDHGSYAINYANTIGDMITAESNNIESFIIGFSNDINKNKLVQIASHIDGFYKEAKTADDMTEVYEKLAEQINSDLPIHEIQFQETFPDGIEVIGVSKGLEVNGRTVTGDIGSISYYLNDETKHFEAQPFRFSITLKATKTGDYVLGKDSKNNNTSFITYKDIDGTYGQKSFPGINISVKETIPPQVTATLRNHATDNNRYTLDLTIDEPAKIEIFDSENTLIHTVDERTTQDSYGQPKTIPIHMEKEKLTGSYITIKGKDKFNNEVTETVSLINLIVSDFKPSETTGNIVTGKMIIQTEENSIIESVKLNGIIIASERNTSDGIYQQNIEFLSENNIIEVTIRNQYQNKTVLNFNQAVNALKLTNLGFDKNATTSIQNGNVEISYHFNIAANLSQKNQQFKMALATDKGSEKLNTIAISQRPVMVYVNGQLNPYTVAIKKDAGDSNILILDMTSTTPLQNGDYTVKFVINVGNRFNENDTFNLEFLSPESSNEGNQLNVEIVKLPKIL